MKPSTVERLRELLSEPGTESGGGYLDFLGQAAQAGPTTGLGQRLMRTSAVPMVYEKYWRPALGRVAKGLRGPSMAEEQAFAHGGLDVGAGDVVLDVACGTGAFTRSFAAGVGQDAASPHCTSSPSLRWRWSRTPAFCARAGGSHC